MSTRNKFISSFGWNGLTVVLQVFIQLVYTSILARLISKESFGLMGVALSAVGFAEIFSQIGIGPALIQRKEVHEQHITGAFYTSLLLGLGFTLLFFFMAPGIADYYESPELKNVIRVISVSFTLSALSIVPRSLMIRAMDFKKFFIAGMVSIIGGNLLVGLTLAFLDYDIWAYVFALVTQNALMTAAFWVLHPVKMKARWEWKYTRQLIRYGGGSTLFNAFNYAGTRIDTLMVPKFISGVNADARMARAGIYERSGYLMSLPITILGKLSDNVMFSGLSALQDQKQKLHKAYYGAVYFIALLVIPACVFIILFAREIVVIYLGKSYLDAIPVVQILFAGVAFRSLIKLNDSVLRALDRLYTGSVIKLLFCVAVAAGIWLGIHRGLEAVAWAVVGATVLQFFIISAYSIQLMEGRLRDLFKALFTALLMGIAVAVLSVPMRLAFDHWSLPALPGILIAVLVNGLGLIAIAWFFPKVFGKGENNPLRAVLERLPINRLTRAFRQRLD